VHILTYFILVENKNRNNFDANVARKGAKTNNGIRAQINHSWKINSASTRLISIPITSTSVFSLSVGVRGLKYIKKIFKIIY
jgi:hypothetical protein